MTVATLGIGQFALLGHQQWREKPGVHAPQTKVHCLQADEREATALHPANQEHVARRRFIHASRARQQEYTKLAARRLQNRDRQAAPKTRPPKNAILGKERLPKRTQKLGPPRGPIFVTVQSKTPPDKCSPRFLLHILKRECLLRL